MSDSEASQHSEQEAMEENSRYASPVFTMTQLDALVGTQEPLGSLPEMEMNLYDTSEEEEEEEDFTNLPLYDDKLDDSDVSEFRLPSEGENEAGKAKKSKRKSDTHEQAEKPASPLAFRPAPKKSAMKKTSQTESQLEPQRWRSRSRISSMEIVEDPMVTARRLENAKPPRRKRKADRPLSKEAEAEKRRRLDPDNQYRILLNNQIREVLSPKLGRGDWKLKRTQVGSSLWRKREKGKLYVALERVGRYDYKAIAEFIGTKSQYEVMEYIKLFEADIKARTLRTMRGGEHRLEEVEIPAAVEISLECEAILEEAADAFAEAQDRKDRRKQRKVWGKDAWLLSADNVSWIEKDVSHKAGETVIKEVLPAAELLNLRNWLKISKGVFMNPADRPEQNWQEIIEPDEEHGIFATAFSDFHTLTVALTKRIMAATMFAAESRLRMDDSSYARKHGRQPLVTHLDVVNAVENMGLKLDSHEFWRTAPRRNHLQMVDDEVDDRKGGVAPMSHYLAEKLLSQRKKLRSQRRMRALANADRRNISSGASAYDSESEGSHISVSSDEEDESHATQEITRGALKMARTTSDDQYIELHRRRSPSPPPSPPPSKPLEEQTAEERYVAYVESVDHVENVRAEAKLWELMQQDHPFESEDMDVEMAEEAVLPMVKLKEKDTLETDKWRERAEYWAPWEHMDGLPTEEDFKRKPNREKEDNAKGPVRPRTKPRPKPMTRSEIARRARQQALRRQQSLIEISDGVEGSDHDLSVDN